MSIPLSGSNERKNRRSKGNREANQPSHPGYPMQHRRIIYEDLPKTHQCLDKSSKVPPDPAQFQECCYHTSGTTVNPKHAMDAAVRKLPPGATLDQLIKAVAPWSTDGGRSLKQVMEDELEVFHNSMERYLDKYLEQQCEILVEKNSEVKARYKQLQAAVIAKHKELKDAVPKDFNWDLYYKDPTYLKTVLRLQEQPKSNVNQSSREVRKQCESNKEWYENDMKQLQIRKKELIARLEQIQAQMMERKSSVKAAQMVNSKLQSQFRCIHNQ